MREWLVPALAFVITAITSQVENYMLPMIMPSMEAQFAGAVGGTYYGAPFPFIAKIGVFQGFDWVSFIVDVVIIGIVLWVIFALIEGILSKRH